MSNTGGPVDNSDHVRAIKSLYTDLATSPDKDFGWAKGKENARRLGYDERWLTALPAIIWESSAAVGCPFTLGDILPGQTVVDLGCGAGTDLCIAALLCGKTGKAIGFDVTPAMVNKSKSNAQLIGLSQVEAFEADFTVLPLDDESADVVISNGSINLSPSKSAVFAEAFRILKSGGRLQFADMVRSQVPGEPVADQCESWADCVSGTVAPEAYIEMLQQVGFRDAELVGLSDYSTAETTVGALFRAIKS